VEGIEKRMRLKRGCTFSDKMDEEITPWLPNIGFSRRRETKYSKIVDLHWHIKEFMA
jgi:hypothetical protein